MKPFQVLSTDKISDYEFVEKNQCLPLYRYTENGERIENITDWGLEQFREHYKSPFHPPFTKGERGGFKEITKEDIFHYTYAVLHNPAYRKKYELNLKREFPRLPFYKDFWQWAGWGKELMDLHIDYETAKPFPLNLVNLSEQKAKKPEQQKLLARDSENKVKKPLKLKVRLKADKETGVIELDEETSLTGIPGQAWEYKLGNRSALEWILDQYKEKKPKDPTIAEKFNTYRFADYKEQVIDLLQRVCTVSVETMKIVKEMEKNIS